MSSRSLGTAHVRGRTHIVRRIVPASAARNDLRNENCAILERVAQYNPNTSSLFIPDPDSMIELPKKFGHEFYVVIKGVEVGIFNDWDAAIRSWSVVPEGRRLVLSTWKDALICYKANFEAEEVEILDPRQRNHSPLDLPFPIVQENYPSHRSPGSSQTKTRSIQPTAPLKRRVNTSSSCLLSCSDPPPPYTAENNNLMFINKEQNIKRLRPREIPVIVISDSESESESN